MPVPAPWTASLKKCKALEATFVAETAAAAKAKTSYLAKEKIYEAQRFKACAAVGYDLKKGTGGDSRKRGEDAMNKDPILKKLGPEIEALLDASAPPSSTPLKTELLAFEKMLAGPDLKGTDGKGKGLPADILKAHKEGTAYIAVTRKKIA
jgi:hypothetical protein